MQEDRLLRGVIVQETERSLKRQLDVPEAAALHATIASEAAKLLGGRIDVRSEVGSGSTFTLTLPLEP